MRRAYETADQIAERSGIPPEGLAEKLESMWRRGQIDSRLSEGVRVFRTMPWVVGIYEFQLNRMDKDFVELCEEYRPVLGPQLVMIKPHLMQVVPVEKSIPVGYEALTYKRVSGIIKNGKSFVVNDCICRKKNRMLGKGCDKPLEICIGIGDEPGLFDNHPWGGRQGHLEGRGL